MLKIIILSFIFFVQSLHAQNLYEIKTFNGTAAACEYFTSWRAKPIIEKSLTARVTVNNTCSVDIKPILYFTTSKREICYQYFKGGCYVSDKFHSSYASRCAAAKNPVVDLDTCKLVGDQAPVCPAGYVASALDDNGNIACDDPKGCSMGYSQDPVTLECKQDDCDVGSYMYKGQCHVCPKGTNCGELNCGAGKKWNSTTRACEDDLVCPAHQLKVNGQCIDRCVAPKVWHVPTSSCKDPNATGGGDGSGNGGGGDGSGNGGGDGSGNGGGGDGSGNGGGNGSGNGGGNGSGNGGGGDGSGNGGGNGSGNGGGGNGSGNGGGGNGSGNGGGGSGSGTGGSSDFDLSPIIANVSDSFIDSQVSDFSNAGNVSIDQMAGDVQGQYDALTNKLNSEKFFETPSLVTSSIKSVVPTFAQCKPMIMDFRITRIVIPCERINQFKQMFAYVLYIWTCIYVYSLAVKPVEF